MYNRFRRAHLGPGMAGLSATADGPASVAPLSERADGLPLVGHDGAAVGDRCFRSMFFKWYPYTPI